MFFVLILPRGLHRAEHSDCKADLNFKKAKLKMAWGTSCRSSTYARSPANIGSGGKVISCVLDQRLLMFARADRTECLAQGK